MPCLRGPVVGDYRVRPRSDQRRRGLAGESAMTSIISDPRGRGTSGGDVPNDRELAGRQDGADGGATITNGVRNPNVQRRRRAVMGYIW